MRKVDASFAMGWGEAMHEIETARATLYLFA
jgi:hypothetical protein